MKFLKRYSLPFLLIIFMITAYLFDLHTILSLETLQERKSEFQEYAQNNPFYSVALFSIFYIVSVALSLPIATLLTLLGGFLFGVLFGSLIVVSSATIGATIIFLIAKTSFGTTLREKAGSLYEKAEKDMAENAVGYLLFLRLVPLFPFFLVNILPALFNIRLSTYVFTTFFGILPGTAVYVYAGQRLGEIENVKDVFSVEVLSAFVLLGLFALVPTVAKRFKNSTVTEK